MALLDFFMGKAKGQNANNIPLISEIATAIYNRLMPGKSNDELYRGWVFSAVQAIAEQIAEIDIKLLRKSQDGKKEQVFEHDALKLLNYVNESSTKYDLFFSTGAHIELNGKYYWIVLPNNLGTPSECVLPDPSLMKPIIDKLGNITSYHLYAEASREFAVIDPALVVPFRNFNPRNNFEGMSTLEATRTAAEIDEYAKNYNKNWFQNSARPDMILKFDSDLSKAQKDALREEWKNRYSGVHNVGKMLVAPRGLTIETISPSHADMEYIEQRKFSREEILGIFRVPKTILGLTEEVNRASAEAALYSFVKFTIMPKYRRIVNALNEYYLPMFKDGDTLEFELQNRPPEDPDALVSQISQGIAGGIYTINDGRRLLGLPEIEGGDVVFLGFGLNPYGAVKTAKIIGTPKKKSIDPAMSKLTSEIMAGIKSVTDATTAAPKSSLPPDFEEKGVNRGKVKEDILKPFEKEFMDASQSLFSDQKKRAILKIKKGGKRYGFKAASDVLDVNTEIKVTIDLFTPLIKKLTAKAGQEALKYVGSEADFDIENAGEFIRKNTTRFAKEITAKTAQDLRVLIAAGVDQGEGADDLAARIENYVGFSEVRSSTIARTETIRGGAAADIEAWTQSGVVSKTIWYTALDERVDDFCSLLHGQEVDLGDSFMNEDSLIEHGIQPYGGSLDIPPAHPNCRCVLIPVVD